MHKTEIMLEQGGGAEWWRREKKMDNKQTEKEK
jgi:hypothetical protein